MSESYRDKLFSDFNKKSTGVLELVGPSLDGDGGLETYDTINLGGHRLVNDVWLRRNLEYMAAMNGDLERVKAGMVLAETMLLSYGFTKSADGKCWKPPLGKSQHENLDKIDLLAEQVESLKNENEQLRQQINELQGVAGDNPHAVPLGGIISQERIRDIFLSNGFTIKQGCSDLASYVYSAAYNLAWYAISAYKGKEWRERKQSPVCFVELESLQALSSGSSATVYPVADGTVTYNLSNWAPLYLHPLRSPPEANHAEIKSMVRGVMRKALDEVLYGTSTISKDHTTT